MEKISKWSRYFLAFIAFGIVGKLVWYFTTLIIGLILIILTALITDNKDVLGLMPSLSMLIGMIIGLWAGVKVFRWVVRYKNTVIAKKEARDLTIRDTRDSAVIENEIIAELKKENLGKVSDSVIEEKIYNKAYLGEHWQVHYAKEKIKTALNKK